MNDFRDNNQIQYSQNKLYTILQSRYLSQEQMLQIADLIHSLPPDIARNLLVGHIAMLHKQIGDIQYLSLLIATLQMVLDETTLHKILLEMAREAHSEICNSLNPQQLQPGSRRSQEQEQVLIRFLAYVRFTLNLEATYHSTSLAANEALSPIGKKISFALLEKEAALFDLVEHYTQHWPVSIQQIWQLVNLHFSPVQQQTVALPQEASSSTKPVNGTNGARLDLLPAQSVRSITINDLSLPPNTLATLQSEKEQVEKEIKKIQSSQNIKKMAEFWNAHYAVLKTMQDDSREPDWPWMKLKIANDFYLALQQVKQQPNNLEAQRALLQVVEDNSSYHKRTKFILLRFKSEKKYIERAQNYVRSFSKE